MKESEDAGKKQTTCKPPGEKTEQQNNNQQSTSQCHAHASESTTTINLQQHAIWHSQQL